MTVDHCNPCRYDHNLMHPPPRAALAAGGAACARPVLPRRWRVYNGSRNGGRSAGAISIGSDDQEIVHLWQESSWKKDATATVPEYAGKEQ